MTTPTDPTSEQFWDAEDAILYAAIAEIALAVYLAGAENGVALMPASIQIFADFETVNEYAIAFLRQYRLGTVHSVNDTTRQKAVGIIEQWLRSGEPMPALQKSLTPLFGDRRARSIGTTEVTRIYSEGNRQAWISTGMVGGEKWQTRQNEQVCPICRPLHNKIVGLTEEFTLTEDEIANSPAMRNLVSGGVGADERRRNRAQSLLKTVEKTRAFNRLNGRDGLQGPPAHVDCHCYTLPVVDLGLVEQRLNEFGLAAQYELLAAELRGRADLSVWPPLNYAA